MVRSLSQFNCVSILAQEQNPAPARGTEVMASEVVTEPRSGQLGLTENIELSQRSRPAEGLIVEDTQNGASEEEIVYPTGRKLWFAMASLCISSFLSGLDITIVAVTIPSLTDEFRTIADIGWYTAAYGMTMSAFVVFFGQIYTFFSVKRIFIIGLIIFEIGSLICTLAPTSAVFVLGRAITGLGRGAINGGMFKLLRFCFPLSKQPVINSIVGGVQSVGFVLAPTIGGALLDAISWRACYGINLPLGVICVFLTAFGVQDPEMSPDQTLPLKEKFKKINLIGTVLIVPATTLLLIAIQWGGIKYGWGDWRIITSLVASVVLFAGFGYLQYRQGEQAILPPKVLRQRSILAGTWYAACSEGVLAVTEYYMSIYFQGVLGYSATKSGLLALPMVGGLAIALILSGFGTTWLGYYYPFMWATSILTPVASGLLTTLNLHEQIGKAVALLTFLGAAVGIGLQGPQIALQAVLTTNEVSMGGAILNFGSGMGSALWICASATLFQNRLVEEIEASSPGVNTTTITKAGLSELREVIGPQRLGSVLAGYENAVIQTLYIPLALALLTVFGAAAMERKSIKKKQS
ncbi:MFS-type efflux pump MFS1 [Paramyrothecium foliicola]|nr:MFS-type efflux pump MFS1 [Paramyrothecium foliicola]